MKTFILTTLLIFTLVPLHNINSTTDSVEPSVNESQTQDSSEYIDVGLIENIYLSESELFEGDNVGIFVKIKNFGSISVSADIYFTILNNGEETHLGTNVLDLKPGSEEYLKVNWITSEGENKITAFVEINGLDDMNPQNNEKTTTVFVEPKLESDFGVIESEISFTKVSISGDYVTYDIGFTIHNFGANDGSIYYQLTEVLIDNGFNILDSNRITVAGHDFERITKRYTTDNELNSIQIQLSNSSIFDTNSGNDLAIKELIVNDFQDDGLQIEISEENFGSDFHTVIPGDSFTLDVTLVSSEASEAEYQVIVGGITSDIKITPDQWKINIIPNIQSQLALSIQLSASTPVDIYHDVELMLYRVGDPNKIVKQIFTLHIVDSYPGDDGSLSTMGTGSGSINIQQNELNPPVIENVTSSIQYPNIDQNLTIFADVYDESILENVTLFYSYNNGSTWQNVSMTFLNQNTWNGTIPSPGVESEVQYYIESFDNSSNSATTSYFYIFFDNTTINFEFISNPGTVSSQDSVSILVNLTDSVGINSTQVFLYYSYNNISFSMIQMTQINGTANSAFFEAFILATTNPLVYYYVEAMDISTLTNTSWYQTYSVDDIPNLVSISVSPEFPNSNTSTLISSDITDDNGIQSVVLHYGFNGMNGSTLMTENGGFYEESIPATNIDTTVYYYISVLDTFGNNVTSSTYQFYSDGIIPSISNVTIDKINPNYLQTVDIHGLVTDTNELLNVTLYYSVDDGNSWSTVNMIETAILNPEDFSADVLIVSHGQNTAYITRNGFTYNSISASQFSSIQISTLQQYRILIVEPDWSNYAYLRNGLAIVDQALNSFQMAISIRVAGNLGSQTDIDLLGTDYDRTNPLNAESFVDPNHPFITGAPWSGATLTTSLFNSWGRTDHGYLYNLPNSEDGYAEILSNVDGITMIEYNYKDSHLMVDTLTSIDGGWGSGNDFVADNFIEYLNYSYYQNFLNPGYLGVIPQTTGDIDVQYYINATDVSGNIAFSSIATFFSDGSVPLIENITQTNYVSETETFSVNASLIDNVGLDANNIFIVYTYDNFTYSQVAMNMVAGNSTHATFNGILPATTNSAVYYYILANDSSGLQNSSIVYSYFVDHLPSLDNQNYSPLYPLGSESVLVNATVNDDYSINTVYLVYNSTSGWIETPMTIVDSIYQGSIPPTNDDVIVEYYISMIDSYGHQINSSIFNFHSDNLDPVYLDLYHNPTQPSYLDDVNVYTDISDLSGIENATLFFSIDSGSTWENTSMSSNLGLWEGTIPAQNQSVLYYVISYDLAGRFSQSEQMSYQIDVDYPSISAVTNLNSVSELSNAVINATVSDNFGVDFANVFLYYSYDNLTWYSLSMTNISGSPPDGIYQGTIPIYTGVEVFYYISASDLSGLISESSLYNYSIDHIPVLNSITPSSEYPNQADPVTIYVEVSDDVEMQSVSISYSISGVITTNFMDLIDNIYRYTIPATGFDTTVYYNLTLLDSFGHSIDMNGYSYYSDGMDPNFLSVTHSPTYPNHLGNVSIFTEITDVNPLTDLFLFYSTDQGLSWTQVEAGQYNTMATKDVLIVSHSQTKTYLTRNGYTYDTISESQFGSISASTLNNYRILILEPNWSNYVYLRNGLAIVDQVLNTINLVISIRAAGNQGSQNNIDFLGTDYDRTYLHEAESFVDTNHPFISGSTYSGNTLSSSYFNSWSSTDHGYFTSLPTGQSGYTEILQNIRGVSMFEYMYKGSHILVDTLTSIDGGWGSGNDFVADNYINYLNSKIGTGAEIPAFPDNTEVRYYLTVSDAAGNTQTSAINTYTVDGIAPIASDITQFDTISEQDTATISATITDNRGIDVNQVYIVYTYDNASYYQITMDQQSGSSIFGVFQGTIPSTTQSAVYYTIQATDISGLTSSSANMSYKVDLLPIISSVTINPSSLNAFEDIMFNSTVIDDYGITNVILHYQYNSNWYSSAMVFDSGEYYVILTAIDLDVDFTYYVQALDSFGNTVSSPQVSVHIDGINPLIEEIEQTPIHPSSTDTVTISSRISDNIGILNATLYYSVNGSGLIGVPVNLNPDITTTGRDPVSGYYRGVTITRDYLTGPLERLYIYGYSWDSDTFYITLWGQRIDTGIFEQFYTISNTGSGYLPEFNWVDPIYEGWRIRIYDSENNDDFYYTYEYDVQEKDFADIPSYPSGTQIEYFIRAFDLSGNYIDSSSYSYITDGESPIITNTTKVDYVPFGDTVEISTQIFDNVFIDDSSVNLYYSLDNSSWFSTSMTRLDGNSTSGIFKGFIPSTGITSSVFYYIYAEDIVGNNVTTSIFEYSSINASIILQSPTEYSILNGSRVFDLEFLVSPSNASVKIRYNGFNWYPFTNISGNLFSFQLDSLLVNEGLNKFDLNFTISDGVSILRSYYFYIDRSAPEFVDYTSITIISETGQTINATIKDAVITNSTSVTLFYTYDNSTWLQTAMVQYDTYNDTAMYSTYFLPDSNYPMLSYYIYVQDNFGWYNQTLLVNTIIDMLPQFTNMTQSLNYPKSDDPMMISIEVSDDIGIQNVILYYTFNSVNYSISMTVQNNVYSAIIPATLIDGNVTYYIEIVDTFGHIINTSLGIYYSDGLAPNIQNLIINPELPNYLDAVDIYFNVDDTNPLTDLSLFYTFDGTSWIEVTVDQNSIDEVVDGRDPEDNSFYHGTVVSKDYNSGPLNSLSIYVYSEDGDTISVSLWGYRIDTGTWEQFYFSNTLISGNIPTFNWGLRIYKQWRIQMSDLDNNVDFYYSYSYNANREYHAQIPQTGFNGQVQYQLSVTDISGQITLINNLQYFTDGIYPTISGVRSLPPVPQYVSPRIWINIVDNTGVNLPVIYYSNDNNTWYSIQMTLDVGNSTVGDYYADIPSFDSGVVSYYIVVTDLHSLTKTSIVRYYTIDSAPEFLFITNYPTDIRVNTDIIVTTYVSDDFGIDIVRLHYWINGEQFEIDMVYQTGFYQATIAGVGFNADIDYLIQLVDTVGNEVNSTLTYLIVDATPPTITYINKPETTINVAQEIEVQVLVEDNFAVDPVSTYLYYSYDNKEWFSVQMQYSSGNQTYSMFNEVLEEIPTNIIYYYVVSSDTVGLMTSTEIEYYTIENYPDADGDQLPDWTEVNVYNTDPFNADSDGDGLNDYSELFTYLTNPSNQDTDSDGMPDGWEVSYGLNPLVNDSQNDGDEDGLTNVAEYFANTNPSNSDTDSDGMPDGWEVENGLNPTIDDSGEDLDSDELTNLQEFEIGTDPNNIDTDEDQMPDGYEYNSQLDPLSDDSMLDPDFDDLSNLEEYNFGTDPQNPDTDEDQMPDGWEIFYGLNPLNDDASLDPDSDELLNLEEFENGTNPNNPDSDSDGMTDGWEVRYGLNPLLNDSELDFDNDGFTNLEEFEIGSDPTNPNDPEVQSEEESNGVIIIIVVVVVGAGVGGSSFVIIRRRRLAS